MSQHNKPHRRSLVNKRAGAEGGITKMLTQTEINFQVGKLADFAKRSGVSVKSIFGFWAFSKDFCQQEISAIYDQATELRPPVRDFKERQFKG